MGRRLFIDADSLQFVEALNTRIPVRDLRFRYDTFDEIDFIFVRSGKAIELEAGTILKFVIKLRGQYDADAIAGIDIAGFSKIGEGESTVYRGYVDTTGDEIKEALNVDSNEENDVGILECHAEMLFSKDGRKQRTQIIDAEIANSLIRDEEGIPSSVPGNIILVDTDLGVTVAPLNEGVVPLENLPPEWDDGSDGAPGADGSDGAPGADGSDGAPGADGSDGAPGAPGADGSDGAPGADGSDGAPGADGAGVPVGGTTGQVLAKASGTDLDTEWVDPGSGGGGSTIGKHTIWLPAGALRPTAGSSNPAFETVELTGARNVGLDTLKFTAGAYGWAYAQIAMPKSWDGGDLSVRMHWYHEVTTVDFFVSLSVRAGAVSNSDVITGMTMGTEAAATDTGGTTNALYVSGWQTLEVAGTPADGDLVIFSVARKIDDTLATSMRLLGLQLAYTTDAETDD